MSITHDLILALKPLIGAKVAGAYLLIWPSEEGLECADMQLHLALTLPDGAPRHLTFRTGSDGQTPMIESERVANAVPYDTVTQRAAAWAAGEHLDDESAHIEAFDISSTQEFPAIVGATIHQVALVCFQESRAPTGIKLTLSSGEELWSVSADDGNRIFRELPPGWFSGDVCLQQVT
jgi:hypothetical protein